MADLSPAAQAALDAFDERYELLGPLEDDRQEQCLAASFLAVALYLDNDCQQLLGVATELEVPNG